MKPRKELTIVIEEQGDQGSDTLNGVAADGTLISEKALSRKQEAT
jgi:hypothetical protein